MMFNLFFVMSLLSLRFLILVLVHVSGLLSAVSICHNYQNPREALQNGVVISGNGFCLVHGGVETGTFCFLT